MLLALVLLGLAAWLWLRPPRSVPAAAWWLITGLTLMFLAAPATRFGYFMYPAGLLAWLAACSLPWRPAWPAGRRLGAGGPGGAFPAGHGRRVLAVLALASGAGGMGREADQERTADLPATTATPQDARPGDAQQAEDRQDMA